MRVHKVTGSVLLTLLCITTLFNVQPGIATADHCPPGYVVENAITDTGNLGEHTCRDPKASFKSNSSSTDAIQDLLTGIVYAFTVWIGSWIAYIGSYIFGFAAGITLQSEAYSLTFLSQMWELVRDIANIAFLFILIYIAFTVIFRAETSGTMQLLAGVIVVALLVNFSFFFTRTIIDAGNILGVQFYNAIDVPLIKGTVKDLSAIVMQGTGVQNILNQQSFKTFADSQTGATGWLTTVGALAAIYITVGIMLFILAAMFLAAGLKLLLRTVVLWLLLIASPLAFIAAALPQTRNRAAQWFHTLVSHAFYPAFFLFLFLIIGKFVGDMGTGSIISDALKASASDPRNGGLLSIGTTIAQISIRLGFIVLLMYLAMKVADALSVAGAGFASKATGRYWGAVGGGLKWAGGGAARMGGNLYTHSVGGVSHDASEALKKKSFGNSALGYRLRKGVLEPLSRSTVGGAKPYSDIVKARKEASKEKSTNMYDIETRKVAADAAVAIKENQKNNRKPEDIDKKQLAKIQEWGKREIGSLGESDIKALASVFTEKQTKLLEDMDKFKDQAKAEARENFENSSPHATKRQAEEQISALREISEKLGNIKLHDKLRNDTQDVKINKESLKDIQKTLEEQYKDADKRYEDARMAKNSEVMSMISEERRNINKGLKHVEKTTESLEKIAEESFTISKA